MSEEYEITKDQDGVTHLDGCNPGGEFTACGWAYDEEESYIPSGEGTKIDCPECLEVIAFFKAIPKRLLNH